jgi:hypothetical protein
MNVHDDNYTFETKEYVTVSGFDVFVYADKNSSAYIAELLDPKAALVALADSTNVDTAKALWQKYGQDINWRILLDQYGDKFQPDISQLFLTQANGNEIVGTVSINLIDETKLIINFDKDTYNTNTVLASTDRNSGQLGTIDAIINPATYTPSAVPAGYRFLLLEDIAESTLAWNNFTADANSIIEFDGTTWNVVDLPEGTVYVTNLRTRIQYKFENNEWTSAFEGEYSKGLWRLVI